MYRRITPPQTHQVAEQPRADPVFKITDDQELIEVIAKLPEWFRVRCGRKPSRATIQRLVTRGPSGGPPIPNIKLFGKRYTSVPAIRWWIEQINRRASSPPTPDRNSQVERAATRLRLVLNPKQGANVNDRT
jgi:hypothetical protein